MSDLFPTKTRLALLRGVAAGEVEQHYGTGAYPNEVRWRDPGQGIRVVTARIEEMLRAGWVRLGPQTGLSMYAPRPYKLTEAGRAVLDGAP